MAAGTKQNDKSKKRGAPRPSSARWAELSSTKGSYDHKVKVVEKNVGESQKQKGSDLSHYQEFKSLTAILENQKKAEKAAHERLNHIYGPNHGENKRYNEEEFERRKREAKKEELRQQLEKYAAKGS